MKTLFYTTVITCLMILASLGLRAQEGTLDNNFGTGGILTLPYGLNDYLKSVIVQPDSKILIGGQGNNGAGVPNPKFYVSRLKTDGTIDGAFNSGNPYTFAINATQTNSVEGMALQADGSIIFGGYTGASQRAIIGKLNSSGIVTTAPSSLSLVTGSNGDIMTGLSYNKVTNSIALSGYDFNTSAIMMGFKFLNNLSPDPVFNGSGSVYLGGTNPFLLNAKAVVNMDNGSVLFAGQSSDFSGNQQYTVVKLRKTGAYETTFGNGIPSNGIATVAVPGFYGYPNAMTLLSSGKILLAGKMNSSNGLGLIRLNADGTVDPTFNMVNYNYPSATGTEAFSIAVQPDNKIIVSGKMQQSVNTFGIVMRFNTDGTIDNTFGPTSSGVLLISNGNTEIYGSDIDVKNKQIYFVGKTNGSNFLVARVNYYVQPYNILGKDLVSASSETVYSIHPYTAGTTYYWSYNSTNIFTSPSTTGDSISLYFRKNSPSGILTCSLMVGGITKIISKSITVNPEASMAESLTDVSCSPSQTRCQNAYINSVLLSARDTVFISKNSGCSTTGYYDFTSSSNYDTLVLGDNYWAKIARPLSAGISLYAGVWIDFDNNGKMNNSKEYVGASFSQLDTIEVTNILIPTDADVGPKRMRIRIGLKEFTYNDCCPTNDEVGETEDYLVLINKFDGIKTPNFITPNDDGKNDLFVIKGVENNVENSLKVYSRVGDLVYHIKNYDNSWAGTDVSGSALKAGTYYYVFTQKSSSKKKEDVVKGFLEIRY